MQCRLAFAVCLSAASILALDAQTLVPNHATPAARDHQSAHLSSTSTAHGSVREAEEPNDRSSASNQELPELDITKSLLCSEQELGMTD